MNICPMRKQDRKAVLDMMRVFYRSPAVLTNGSEEIFQADVDHCIGEDPFLEGFVFREDDSIIGYAMIAKSFSTEFGKHCVWIEDLYLVPEKCNKGYGSQFLSYIHDRFPDTIQRLEVERENERAVHTYRKAGFSELPYVEMKR